MMNTKTKLTPRIAITVVLTAATLISARTTNADPQYTVTDLGSQYATRPFNSQPAGINNLGQAVGTFTLNNSQVIRTALFDNRTIVNINNTSGIANAINDHSQVVGTSSGLAFLYDATGFHSLGAAANSTSIASSINNSGDIVGTNSLYTVDGTITTPFLYHNGVMTPITTPNGGGDANDINDLGDIVGSYFTGYFNTPTNNFSKFSTAYLVHNGVFTSLGSLGTFQGLGISDAYAINNAGQAVGYAGTDDGAIHAALFSSGHVTDLGSFGGKTIAKAINSAGQIVGNVITYPNYVGVGLIFNGTTPVPLNTLIDPLAGWDIFDAVGINDSGVILVWGKRDGYYHAALLTPNVAATSIPPVPANAAAAVWNSAQIDISWDVVPSATRYNIYRNTIRGGAKSIIGTAYGNSTFDDYNLTANTRYYYTVSAVNRFGESVQSSEVAATTRAAVPLGVPNVYATSPTVRQVQLSWPPAGAATDYEVFRSLDSSTYTSLGFTNGGTAFLDNNLIGNTLYYYKITPSNIYGDGPASGTSITTPQASVPGHVTATGIAGNKMKVTWDNTDYAPSHDIFRSSVSGQLHQYVGSATGLTFTDTGLQPNTNYYYVVSAVYRYGNTLRSPETMGTTLNIPTAAPTLSASAVNCSNIHLSWTTVPAATSYTIYRSSSAGENYAYVGTSTTTQFDNTGLAPLTTGYYVVEAHNSNGSGPKSNEAHATTSALPTTPWNLTATAISKSRIDLHWTKPYGASSYQIFRSTASGTYHTYIDSTTDIQYANTGLTASTSYYYIVVAVNANGSGPKSSEAGAKTLAH